MTMVQSVDDRGHPVRLMNPAAVATDRRFCGTDRDDLRSELLMPARHVQVILVLASIPGFVLAVLGTFQVNSGNRLIGWVGVATGAIILFVPGFWWHYTHRGGLRMVAVLRKHCLCSCCGYDLRKTPIAGDGCTVCPECGAAWRLENRTIADAHG
jgi:hypothetical protein